MRRLVWLVWALLITEFALATWLQRPWMTPDSPLYLELARNLSTAGFVSHGVANDLRTPGYPWFLNILHERLHLPLLVVILTQGALCLGAIWLIGHKVIQSSVQRVAFLVLAAATPALLFYSASVMAEALAIYCVAVLLALMNGKTSIVQWGLAGAVVGLGALVRTPILPMLGGVIIVALYRRQFIGAVAAGLAAFTVLLPYMLWNLQHFDRFTPVPVASTIGQSLFIASWEPDLDLLDLQYVVGNPATERAVQSGYVAQVNWAQTQSNRDDALKALALRRIEADPAASVARMVKGLWRLFNTARYPAPGPVDLALRIAAGLAWILGLVGAILAVRDRRDRCLLVLATSLLLPLLPLHTEARYTAPIRLILLFYASSTVRRAVACRLTDDDDAVLLPRAVH